MATVDLNVSPYFDDYDPSKDYLRVLFRPGFAVQARELTQLQTALQEQIKRFGDHTFKGGSKVTEAPVSLDTSVYSINLVANDSINFPISGADNGSLGSLGSMSGKILTYTNRTTGKVVKFRTVDVPQGLTRTSQIGRVYFTYLSQEVFDSTDQEGYVYALGADNNDLQTYFNVFSGGVSPSTLFTIGEGVYYIDGFFTRVAPQTVVVSNTTQAPTVQIGLVLNSRTIDANEDATLYDNARGSSNEGAPGANRLQNNLQLSVRTGTINDPNFYRLVTVVDGIIQEDRAGNPIFNELEKVLARRTYDESGNYSVNPIHATVEPHRTDETMFNLNLAAAKSYVRGFEIDVIADTKVPFERGLQTQNNTNSRRAIAGVPYVNVSAVNAFALPGFTNADGASGPHSSVNGVLNLLNAGNQVIGVARPYGYEDGKLYLYDIKLYQSLTLSSGITGTAGNEIVLGTTRGYLAQDYTNATTVTIVGANTRFGLGAISSSTATVGSATITAVAAGQFSDVRTIRSPLAGSNVFIATVTDPTIQNATASLLVELESTLKSVGEDNDFVILKHQSDAIAGSSANASSWTNPQNGGSSGWTEFRVDDASPIEKQLRFEAVRLTHVNGVNYGWSPQHRDITLIRPDVYRVYGIYQAQASGTAPSFTIANITQEGAGALLAGSIITGATSGAKAIVALAPDANRDETSLSNNALVHRRVRGSGSTGQIQIIPMNDIQFAANENITVSDPEFHPYQETDSITPFPSSTTLTFLSYAANQSKDITSNFNYDDGQRSNYYDVGRLIRKGNAPVPMNGDLIVLYSYWEDTRATEFNPLYNVNSYTRASFFGQDVRFYGDPRDIVSYDPSLGVNLRNTLDFRFKINPVTEVANNAFVFTSRNFHRHPHIIPDSRYTFDYEEYLPRRATVALTSAGNYIKVLGTPSKQPRLPDNIPEDSMATHNLYIPAAVRYPSSQVEVERIDNRRYTMRDIGALDYRLRNMEDAVALSLLESQALNDDVGTTSGGSPRLRTGFIVDDFKDVNSPVADRTHPEFNAAYVRDGDLPKQALSPASYAAKVIATDVSTTNIDPYFAHADRGYFVKSYTEEVILEQLQASSEHRINPYATWVFNGEMTLSPARWVWPQVVVEANTNRNRTLAVGERVPNRRVASVVPRTIRTWSNTSDNTRVRSQDIGGATRTFRAGTRTTTNFALTETTRDIRTIDHVQLLNDTLPNGMMYTVRPPQGGLRVRASGMRPHTDLVATIDGVNVTRFATGGAIRSDGNGRVDTVVMVPADTFTPGDLRVVLSDASGAAQTNASTAWIARGEAHFERSEIQRSRRTNVTGRTTANVNETISITPNNDNNDNDNNDDPIAQTFQIPSNGGRIEKACITSVDLYFATVDPRGDETVGAGQASEIGNNVRTVKVEIREVVNGYPGPTVLGQSLYEPIAKDAGSTDSTKATNFRVTDNGGPVFLNSNKEYCIVVKTPSEVTSVWTAAQGEIDKVTGSAISAQPNVGGHFGSFFKSQNNSTWEPDQNRDLKFRLHRAKFSTVDSTIGLRSKNDNPYEEVGAAIPDALTTYAGSPYIKVKHPNHGMYGSGHRVLFFGVQPTHQTTGTFNGFPLARVNNNSTGHEVFYPTKDSYFIRILPEDVTQPDGTSAPDFAVNSIVGDPTGDQRTFQASYNIQYTAIRTKTGYEPIHDDATMKFEVKGVQGTNVDLTATSTGLLEYATGDGSTNSNRHTLDTSFEDITIDDYASFDEPKVIFSQINNRFSYFFEGTFTLSTTNDYVSPFFEMQDTTESMDGVAVPIEAYNSSILNTLDFNEIDTLLDDVVASNNASDREAATRTSQFVSQLSALEAAFERSTYVTNNIDLEVPADTLRINFDADMQSQSLVEVYYKTRVDDTPFEEIEWTKFPENQQVTEANFGRFSDDVNFEQYSLSAETDQNFTSFKVKLVMSARNEARVPNIRDLRIIAVA